MFFKLLSLGPVNGHSTLTLKNIMRWGGNVQRKNLMIDPLFLHGKNNLEPQ